MDKCPGTGSYVLKVLLEKEHPEWAFDCPQRVRLWAVDDALRATKAAKKKCFQGAGYQRLSFRSRKDIRQRFAFDKKSLGEGSIFKGKHSIEFHGYEPLPGKEDRLEGTKLVCESGRYFLIVPVKMPRKQVREPRQPCVALDPGVRTFLTYYSEQTHGKIGEQAFQRIVRLCLRIDDLLGRMSKTTARRRYRMRKALMRMRWKVKDLINDLHWKAAVFLVTRFDVIYMPTFETKQMSCRTTRKIRRKTVRSMLSFAFFRFKQILQHAAEMYGAKVYFVNEAYTSKTCSYCGHVQEVGGRKRFRCKNCQVDIDRDYNGARGIFLSCVAGSGLRQ